MTLQSTRRACVQCQVELRPLENGVYILEMANYGPYKIWPADIWECPKCEFQLLTGLADQPMLHHWQDGFTKLLAHLEATARVIKIPDNTNVE